jgi:hypothetical protein
MDNRIKNYYTKLINSQKYNFSNLKSITDKQGVYVIYNKKDIVLHVGRTIRGFGGLRQRLGNHKKGQSSFVRIFLKGDKNKIKDCAFKCIKVPKYQERAWLEGYAIGMLCPRHIG